MPKKKSARKPGAARPDGGNKGSLADAALLLTLLEQRGGFEAPRQRAPRGKRRARRRTPAAFRVRVDLDGSKPPIWRRLVLASDLRLDEVHEALQIAFEWGGHHLHEFREAGDVRSAERFVCEPMLEDSDVPGTPESEVYLDQVLAEPGDRLHYTYDFGDDWIHTIRLEEILPQDDDAPRARVIGGRRAAPPDDCGGIYGYQALLHALADPSGPERERVREWLEQYVGDPTAFEPANVDIEGLDQVMREAF